jgi:hypothetical protein
MLAILSFIIFSCHLGRIFGDLDAKLCLKHSGTDQDSNW